MAEFMPKEGQLLFISDIEGCLEKQGPIEQNVSLCELNNYLTDGPLYKFLSNPENKIAFLGDYFDKGPGVASSIKGIRSLHESFPHRVHIILGNRDVNKFRLGYEVLQSQEMTLVTDPLDNTKWSLWKDFYTLYLKTNDIFERFTTILNNSMGAGPLIKDGPITGAIISNELNKLDDKDKAARIGAYYLTKVFDEKVTPSHFEINDADTNKPELNTFVEDCRYLFKNGDIVKGDDEYNVLMSHAGGFNKCILQPGSFFDNIMGNTVNDKYFDEMERMRRALGCSGSESALVDIHQAVAYHNNLYKKFVNDYFTTTIDRNTLLREHLLLQAMGLKPDGPPSNFASFIQSCGSGCGIIDDDKSMVFIENLGTYKAIAHGHVPHCMRHPLLINRTGIVFISNDTSNGNRPKKDGSLSSLPLSYIQKSEDGPLYGIGFIESDGTIRTPSIDDINTKNNNEPYTINKNEDATKIKEVYNILALIGGPYPVKDIPNTATVKEYMKWNGFAPGDIRVPETVTGKGGSTRKKQKRGGKKNTRRIVKNNRKTKRRSKHHCSHCK